MPGKNELFGLLLIALVVLGMVLFMAFCAAVGIVNDETRDAGTRLRARWFLWAFTTYLAVLYCGAARLEGQATRINLTLTPGNETHLRVFRAAGSPLNAALTYNLDCQRSGQRVDDHRHSAVVFEGYLISTPDPEVQLQISKDDGSSTTYEARPADRNCGQMFRYLTPNLSVAPGIYRQRRLDDVSDLQMAPLVNTFRVVVSKVDPALVGKSVDLVVLPPLGFKTFTEGWGWLWFAIFLEPVFWITQTVWLLSLIWRHFRKSPVAALAEK